METEIQRIAVEILKASPGDKINIKLTIGAPNTVVSPALNSPLRIALNGKMELLSIQQRSLDEVKLNKTKWPGAAAYGVIISECEKEIEETVSQIRDLIEALS